MFAATTAFLARTEWAAEIGEPLVRRSIEGSIAFGVYDGDQQVGFARVVTDRATFAWVGDVFILDSHRGLGLGLWLMRCVLAHPDLQELRRWALVSTSARGLYAKLGFTPARRPGAVHGDRRPDRSTAGSARGRGSWRFRPSVRNGAIGLYSPSRDRDHVEAQDRPRSRRRPRPVLAPRPRVVRGELRGADGRAGPRLGGDRRRPPHADPRPDGERQDARGIPLDARPARDAPDPAARARAARPAPSASSTSPR